MKFLLIALLIFNYSFLNAQDQRRIEVHGVAYDASNRSRRLDDLMIINQRTSQGIFGKADGSFSVQILEGDSIIVASTGYEFKYISFKDSAFQSSYNLDIPLIKLNVNLKPVSIFTTRDLESIYNDIQKLGYNKRDFELSPVDALNSPITFLYNEFSRLQQLKKHNAERINNEKRRQLLKQLLANYVEHDIIDLNDNEFDSFIDFANVPETYMKTASQYDFAIYIKNKYFQYRDVMQRRY